MEDKFLRERNFFMIIIHFNFLLGPFWEVYWKGRDVYTIRNQSALKSFVWKKYNFMCWIKTRNFPMLQLYCICYTTFKWRQAKSFFASLNLFFLMGCQITSNLLPPGYYTETQCIQISQHINCHLSNTDSFGNLAEDCYANGYRPVYKCACILWGITTYRF